MRAWLPPMAGGLTRPAWFALALLVALAATAGPAQAQTRLLVGNTTAGTARSWEVTSGADFSQAFTTGANSAGYTVANVEIAFNGTPTAADLTALTVTVRTVAEGNNLNPGPASAVVGTFTDPGSGTAGLNTFTAPGSGIQLEASTTYFISFPGPVVQNTKLQGQFNRLGTTLRSPRASCHNRNRHGCQLQRLAVP